MQSRIRLLICALGWLLCVPAMALAQGAIGGVVRDTSGAVLPGVTVEAASPALIEKVRAAVTDDRGQYLIINLRPGTYTVTFTLPGFNSFKREGIILSAGTTLPVNAEMGIGTLEETVTVTGESPVVDVQSTREQTVVDRELLDAIPRTRSQQVTGALLPGVVITGVGATDVGGSAGPIGSGGLAAHGGDPDDQSWSVDGIKLVEGGRGAWRQLIVSDATAQEYTYETSALSAEFAHGGVRLNLVPKEGGNQFRGSAYGNFSSGAMVSNNLSDEIKARGLVNTNGIDKLWDFSPAFGGPIQEDRLWFFSTYRHTGRDTLIADAFWEADPTRQAVDVGRYWSVNGRLTWQASRRNKISIFGDTQSRYVPYWQVSSTRTPEASIFNKSPKLWLSQARWTSPVTNRLLFEAAGSFYKQVQFFGISPATQPGAWPVQEITTGKLTGRRTGAVLDPGAGHWWTFISNMSYVTGTHSFKVGLLQMFGCRCNYLQPNLPTLRMNNGVPFQVQLEASPRTDLARLNHDFGVFAQDQWTIGRLTFNMGVRFDWLNEQIDEQNVPAGDYVPARHLDRIPNVPNWKDISPRVGFAWDVFGTGRTALKASASRYLQSEVTNFATSVNPMNAAAAASDTRLWTDRNNDRIPQLDELGPSTNLNFGLPVLSVRPADDVRDGWAARPNNWEYSVSIQQQVLQALSVTAGYYRRSFRNLTWTDNTALEQTDYTPFTFVSPLDGERITAYNLNPAKRGLGDNVIVFADDNSRVFNGVDLSVTGRFGTGGRVTAGLTTGRTETNSCTTDNPNSLRFCEVSPPYFAQNLYKVVLAYPLPYGIQASGTFQSLPGAEITANYTVTSAIAGVPLTLGSITVPLLEPGQTFEERLNRIDLRLSKTLRTQRITVNPYVDVYNALNASPVLSINNTYGPLWKRPSGVLIGRMVQVGMQVDF